MSSDGDGADIPAQPPADTDLYEVLGVSNDATPDQIKSAYRKLALKHHPDKAPADAKDEANQKFQQVAFAYAILSDSRRRQRFDLTGSTAEAVDIDDDFNWVDFYREQFSSAIDTGAIDKLKAEYQGSAEETRDVLAAFEKYRGDLDRVYESVMLCNVLDDDERFRAVIDQAIANETVEPYAKYTEESERTRQLRLKRAQREAKEAAQAAKKLDEKKARGQAKDSGGGRRQKPTTSKGAGGRGGQDDLAALIQQRQASRAESFFDRLEEKYAPGKKRSARVEEPPEEAFAATAARQTSKRKKAKA